LHLPARQPDAIKINTGLGGEYQVAGANRRWRCQFRCRGSRRESAVAQLFSLGCFELYEKMRKLWFGESRRGIEFYAIGFSRLTPLGWFGSSRKSGGWF
jgi:hypothetical protein